MRTDLKKNGHYLGDGDAPYTVLRTWRMTGGLTLGLSIGDAVFGADGDAPYRRIGVLVDGGAGHHAVRPDAGGALRSRVDVDHDDVTVTMEFAVDCDGRLRPDASSARMRVLDVRHDGEPRAGWWMEGPFRAHSDFPEGFECVGTLQDVGIDGGFDEDAAAFGFAVRRGAGGKPLEVAMRQGGTVVTAPLHAHGEGWETAIAVEDVRGRTGEVAWFNLRDDRNGAGCSMLLHEDAASAIEVLEAVERSGPGRRRGPRPMLARIEAMIEEG